MKYFIGRKEELKRLSRASSVGKAALVVVKGRRRVGKSTLIKEFAKGKNFISLSGNPPGPGVTAQKQRDEFAGQLCSQLSLPMVTFLTWSDAFRFLSQQIKDKETVVLLDEISWMGGVDPSFLGAMKTWWDQYASEKNQLTIVLCSSISTWIEENILCSTGFVGRISLVIHLKPFTLSEAVYFLKKKGFKGSIYEILKILSVTGGIPWYLDLIHPRETADENIYEICFESSSQLINEFQTIFHDLFDRKGESYRKVLEILVDGMKTQKEIRELLSYKGGGTISSYLKHLVSAGFISDHYQWSLQNGKVGKQKLYRLSDCYIRFHLKYVEPHQELIKQGLYKKASKGRLPGWDTIMGFQLESLLMMNREFLFEATGINPDHVICDNPYTQTPSTRHKGVQIDYLIQTKLNSLIVCEFKFRRREIGTEIIKEVKKKCDILSVPRGFGIAPVLFHLGGVHPKVEESQYFYRIVDLRDLFEENL